jgi:uncharacterized phage-associated protein
MPYDAKAIANEFLDRAEQAGTTLDPIKLQKLVYFAHGWSLALRDEPLIDEQVEARSYGPVVPSLRRAFRRFGDGPIEGRAIKARATKDRVNALTTPRADGPDAGWVKGLLDWVWKEYGPLSTDDLATLCADEGSPWDQIWESYGGALPKGTDVPPALIRDYFLKQSRQEATTS